MPLLEFIKEYPDEFSCKIKFKQYREQVGVVCPKCGGEAHYWKRDKDSYECKRCKHRQGLRANTVTSLNFLTAIGLSPCICLQVPGKVFRLWTKSHKRY